METPRIKRDTAPMNEKTCNDLFERAVSAAYNTFKQASDDHIQGVFERLVWNHVRGLALHGATTVH